MYEKVSSGGSVTTGLHRGKDEVRLGPKKKKVNSYERKQNQLKHWQGVGMRNSRDNLEVESTDLVVSLPWEEEKRAAGRITPR